MIITNAKTHENVEFKVLQDVDFSSLNHLLRSVSPMYPDFNIWLNFTFRRNLASGQRKIAIAHYGSKMVGVALLKKDELESKICTFYVTPDFREIGIGQKLMDIALESLNSSQSFITVADERKDEIFPLLKSKGFKLLYSIKDLYRPNISENFYSL